MAVAVADLEQADTPLTRLYGSLRRHGPTLNLLFEYARTVPNEDETIREAFAGAIAVALHDLLRRFRKDSGAGKHDSKQLGPEIEGCSVPQIVSAAAKRNGKKHGFRTNSSWPLLEILSERGGYARIDSLLREYAAAVSEVCSER